MTGYIDLSYRASNCLCNGFNYMHAVCKFTCVEVNKSSLKSEKIAEMVQSKKKKKKKIAHLCSCILDMKEKIVRLSCPVLRAV